MPNWKAMHFSRVGTFLLGAWIGCSLFLAVLAFENVRFAGRLAGGSIPPATEIINTAGPEQARLLLRHFAWEQNRLYFTNWEKFQMPVAAMLALFLYLTTDRRILPPIARGVYGGMARSWHYTTENESILTNLLAGDKPIVGAFLHARTFQLLYYFSRPQRGRWMLMCSRSSDGDLMTSVEKGLGYRVARGSSGSGGSGRPVATSQNRHDRVQMSPRIMIVSARRVQHSPMFGQLALSHTVWSASSLTIARSSKYAGLVGSVARIHSGCRRRGAGSLDP